MTLTHAEEPRSLTTGKTDPSGLAQLYAYDSVANRTLLVNPDNGRYTTTFDALDRTYSSQVPTGEFYTSMYDANGRRTTLQLGLGTVRIYAFDPTDRLTTQIDYAGSTPITTQINSYDPVSNRTVQVVNGVATTWVYDVGYRLLGQQNAGGYATFSYDSLSNTLVNWNQGQAPISMSYNVASRLTTSIQGSTLTTYTFDNAGNRTVENASGALTTYSFDCENNEVGISSPSGLSTYTWSGSGLRRSNQEPGQPVYTTVWDGANYLGEVQ